MSGAGNITKRGKTSWRLKFEGGSRDPQTGKRKIQYLTVRGSKREAQVKLAELVAAVGSNAYVEPSRVTVAEHVRARVDQWEVAGKCSGKTAERYRELVENQIVPHLGAQLLQKLKPLDIEEWHGVLRTRGRKGGTGGVGSHTAHGAHRVLAHALADAVRSELVTKNVALEVGAPALNDDEVQIVPRERLAEMVEKLRGHQLYTPAIVSLFAGLRRGEILALRWSNVDLDGKVIRIRESLEQTRAGLRVKTPKTKAGRRDLSLPAIVVDALRDHRRQQLELRMALGAGKPPDNSLVFPTPLTGEHQRPETFSTSWGRLANRIGFAEITYHALRHAHASQLIDAGVDIVTITRRLGHASPTVTLRIYAHLFRKDDSKASEAIDAALAGLGQVR